MQLTQKDKIMLIVLLIIVIVGASFMYLIKPNLDEKKEIETYLTDNAEAAKDADLLLSSYNADRYSKKFKDLERLKKQYQDLFNSTATEGDVWNGTREEFKTNYALFFYMLNEYMPSELGMLIDNGNVSITTYTIVGSSKEATMNISAFTLPNYNSVEKLLSRIALEQSLTVTSLNLSPSTVDDTLTGSITLKITLTNNALE